MSLRHRLTLIAAVVVGVTIALASLAAYAAMRSELRGQVDRALRNEAPLASRPLFLQALRRAVMGEPLSDAALPAPPGRLGGGAPVKQAILGDGATIALRGDLTLPVDAGDRALAAGGGSDERLRDVHVDGTHLRVLTARVGELGAIQFARPLASADQVLERLRLVLGGLLGLGTLLAALITSRLARRLEVSQDALHASLAAQRQLVADASHELRTPITTLRANAEILGEAGDDQTPAERRALTDDVVRGAEELSLLVTDLIELSRGEAATPEVEDVRLDELTREAVQRAQRHAPAVRFACDLRPSVVAGVPDRLARAVNNLLDNATKYGGDGSTVEVAVAGGELWVRDHGPGVPPDELPHVFDRFYRGAGVRDRQGSGLGLAIVAQVAESHGGTASVEPAPGGGTLARLRLPEATPNGAAP